MHDVPRGELDFPLMHPLEVQRSCGVDSEIFRIRFQPPPVPFWVMVKSMLLQKSKLIRALNRIRKKIIARMKNGSEP